MKKVLITLFVCFAVNGFAQTTANKSAEFEGTRPNAKAAPANRSTLASDGSLQAAPGKSAAKSNRTRVAGNGERVSFKSTRPVQKPVDATAPKN